MFESSSATCGRWIGASSRSQSTTPAKAGGGPATAPGRRPPTRPAWKAVSAEKPVRAYARPGVLLAIRAASRASMTSVDSESSVTRSAIRRLVLARITGDTTPDGRWVARIRCTPSDRPRMAMPTRPVTNSGSSSTSDANSSMIRIVRGIGSTSKPGGGTNSGWSMVSQ